MIIARIESVLTENVSAIISGGSFAERLEVIYNLLDKEFPRTSVTAAIYGPITCISDFMSRTQIEPLLYAIKQSIQTGTKCLVTDKEINDALQLIYEIVK